MKFSNKTVRVLLMFSAACLPGIVGDKLGIPFSNEEATTSNSKSDEAPHPLPSEMSLPHMTKPEGETYPNSNNNDPPYGGTIFQDGGIITESHPTALQSIEIYDQTRCVIIFDRRNNAWTQFDNAHIFDVNFSDGLKTQFWVAGSDYSRSEAQDQVLKYADYLGRVPQFLRLNIRVTAILAGNNPWGGHSDGHMLIHADFDYSSQGNNGDDITEEVMVHEAGHVTLDQPIYDDSAWSTAVAADGKFISTYARDYPNQEDVAESIVLWLGIAVETVRDDIKEVTMNQIPKRLEYFTNQEYNLFPLDTASGGEVPGYNWEPLSPFYYSTSNCERWDGEDGGSKSVIFETSSPAPSESPSMAPSESPSMAPSSPALSCTDSPLKVLTAKQKRSAKTCIVIANHPKKTNFCKQTKIKTHCPSTCEVCDEHGLSDSTGAFLVDNKKRNCKAWLHADKCGFESLLRVSSLCQNDEIRATCRQKCGLFVVLPEDDTVN